MEFEEHCVCCGGELTPFESVVGILYPNTNSSLHGLCGDCKEEYVNVKFNSFLRRVAKDSGVSDNDLGMVFEKIEDGLHSCLQVSECSWDDINGLNKGA